MAKVLLTRPVFDLATKYLGIWGHKFIEENEAKGWGHIFTDLYEEAATLENFENNIALNDIFLGLGHGNKKIFTGQDNEVLIHADVNADVMSGKPTFLASCLTGITLLPRMVEEACPEAYGYTADWVFVYHPDYYPDRVLEDPYASPFFDCMLTTGYAVLLRKTPLEVYEETIARYNYWWSYWLKQNDPFTDDILTWLNWNKRNFIAVTPDGIHRMAAPLVPMQLALPMGAAALFLLATMGGKQEKA